MSVGDPGWIVGDQLEERQLPPSARLQLAGYAQASGDLNPIHTDDAEAARAGLPGVIQHGMLTMAQMGSLFSPYFQHAFVEHFQTRFSGMVFVGDALRIGGRVSRVEPSVDAVRYTLDVYARTAEGRQVSKATVRLVCPAE